jgi:hypothetical protein
MTKRERMAREWALSKSDVTLIDDDAIDWQETTADAVHLSAARHHAYLAGFDAAREMAASLCKRSDRYRGDYFATLIIAIGEAQDEPEGGENGAG